MSMHVTLLKGNATTIEAKTWKRWLTCAGRIAQRFDKLEDDDPFAYNERASVSILTAAAAMAGMLSIAEYSVDKKHRRDRRKKARGTADFWLRSERRTWSIEFKQRTPDQHMPSPKELDTLFEKAVGDARHLYNIYGETRVGALIVPTFWVEEKHKKAEKKDKKARELRRLLHEFGQRDTVQFFWKIDPGGVHSGTTFFYFSKVL